MAIVTGQDLLAGRLSNPASRLRLLVGKANGLEHRSDFDKVAKPQK
jgi:hypothetical protein